MVSALTIVKTGRRSLYVIKKNAWLTGCSAPRRARELGRCGERQSQTREHTEPCVHVTHAVAHHVAHPRSRESALHTPPGSPQERPRYGVKVISLSDTRELYGRRFKLPDKMCELKPKA